MVKSLAFFYGFTGISLALFFVTESDRLRVWSFFFFLLFMAFTAYYHIHLVSKPRQLQRRLRDLNSNGRSSLAALTKEYHQLCLLHHQLPIGHQTRFQQPVQEVRERIERILKAAKVMETVLQNAGSGSLDRQRQNYEDIFEIYQKLPEDVQQEYYSQMMQAKELLEGKR